MKYSKEILKFRTHFERRTGVGGMGVVEDKHFPHWKRIELASLSGYELIKIGEYIHLYLGGRGFLTEWGGKMTLTVDVDVLRNKKIV